jgi:hypothetical protein
MDFGIRTGSFFCVTTNLVKDMANLSSHINDSAGKQLLFQWLQREKSTLLGTEMYSSLPYPFQDGSFKFIRIISLSEIKTKIPLPL